MNRLIRIGWMAGALLIASPSFSAQPQKLFNNQRLYDQATQTSALVKRHSAQSRLSATVDENLLAQTLHQQFQLDDASKLVFKTKTVSDKQSIYQFRLQYKNLPVHSHDIAVVVSPSGEIVQGYGKLVAGIAEDVEPLKRSVTKARSRWRRLISRSISLMHRAFFVIRNSSQ